MHLLLVADGRSPITQRWLQVLKRLDYRLSLVSTFPCSPPNGLEHFEVLPVAFGQAGASLGGGNAGRKSALKAAIGRFRGFFMAGRYYLGPWSARASAGHFRQIVADWKPDLVHALRIPYEGMLATATPTGLPLVVSIWGNDLTLHAQGSPWMRTQTLACLQRADGLMADAHRDIRLGRLWGLRPQVPGLVVPGSGGLDLNGELAQPVPQDLLLRLLGAGEGDASQTPLLLNPRGLRPGSVRTDVFFQALPEVLQRVPETLVLCAAMAGQPEAQQAYEALRPSSLKQHVFLLPYLPQTDLWGLFRLAQVSVSPSAHDGTPNSLLEAMACGCFPVAGDIESLREWITPGVNGLLVPPNDAAALAEALVTGLTHPELRQRAAAMNARIITERASVEQVAEQLHAFYTHLCQDG